MKLNAFTSTLLIGLVGTTVCIAKDEVPWGEIESKQWASALGQLDGVDQRPGRVTPVKTDPALTTVTHAYGRFNSLPAVDQVAPVTDHWNHRPVRGAEATFDGLRARRIRYKSSDAASQAGQQLVNMMTDPTVSERISQTKAPVVIQVRGDEVLILEGSKLNDPAVLKSVQDKAWEGKNPNANPTSVVGTFGTPDANGVRAFSIDTTDQTGAIAQNAARTQDAVNTMSEDSPGFRRYSDFAFEERSPNGDVAQVMQTEDGPVSVLMAPSLESATEVDKLARVVDGRRRDPLEALDSANKGNQQLVGMMDDQAVVLVRDEQGNVERRVGSADGDTYDFTKGEVKPLDAEQQKLMAALQNAGWLKDDVEAGLAPTNQDTLIVDEPAETTTIAQADTGDDMPAQTTIKLPPETADAEGSTTVIKDLADKMDAQGETQTKPAETDTIVKNPQAETETKPAAQDETETKPAETDTVVKNPQAETETKPAAQDETETKPAETDTVVKNPQAETETKPAAQDETETKPAETDTIVKNPQAETETKPAAQDETETKPAETDTVVKNPQAETETKPAETDTIVKNPQDETETKPAAQDETETKPAAQDETETKPAAQDETETKPAAQDETETKPAAQDETETKPAAQDETETKPSEETVARVDETKTENAELSEAMMEDMRKALMEMEANRVASETALKQRIAELEASNSAKQQEIESLRARQSYGTDPLTFPSLDRTQPVYDPLTGTYRPRSVNDWAQPDAFLRPEDYYGWRNDYRNGLNGYNPYDPFNNNSFNNWDTGSGNNNWFDQNNQFSGENSSKSGFDEAVKLAGERTTKKMELIRDLQKEKNELIRKLGAERANEILNNTEGTIAETTEIDRPFAAENLAPDATLRVITPGALTVKETGAIVGGMQAGITPSTRTLKANANTLVNFQGGVQGGKAPYVFVWRFRNTGTEKTGQTVSHTFFGKGFHVVELVVTDADKKVARATVQLTVESAQ